MPSAIDPTKPADGAAAFKADIRANFDAARNEILELQQGLGGSGLPGVLNVKDYGAVGDGTTNDTAAFDAAAADLLNIAHPRLTSSDSTWQAPSGVQPRVQGAILFIPPGVYALNNWTVDRAITVRGCGRASRFVPHSTLGSSGFIMRVEAGTGAELNSQNHHPGFLLDNVLFDGCAREQVIGGALELNKCGTFTVGNCWFEEINGHAIHTTNGSREGQFHDLLIRYCGNSTRPAINIYTGAADGDGENNLFFRGLICVANGEVTFFVGGSPDNGQRSRNIFFSHCMVHGNGSGIHLGLDSPNLIRLERCINVHITACQFNAWEANQGGCIFITPDPGTPVAAANSPDKVFINNCVFQRAHGGIDASATNPHVRLDDNTDTKVFDWGNSVETSPGGFKLWVSKHAGSTGEHWWQPWTAG